MAISTPMSFLVKDLIAYRKDIADDIRAEFLELSTYLQQRGDYLLLVDFPDACKVLDASLSVGYIDYPKLPTQCKVKDSKSGKYRPKWFPKLWDSIFAANGDIFCNVDQNDIFFLRQFLLLYKKLEIDCPPENLEKAVAEFVEIERTMDSPTLNWGDDVLCLDNLGELSIDRFLNKENGFMEKPLRILEKVFDIVISRFPILDPNDIIPKHGPGAVADLKTGTDKYRFKNWPRKLSYVFDAETFAKYSYGADGAGDLGDEESPAKLIAVPKTYKSPRLIASEPVAHQFIQQGLMRWFRSNLPPTLRTSINFYSQDLSKQAALACSKDLSSGTVDLSSASDRLSLKLIESAFRRHPSLLVAMHAVRTRKVFYQSSEGPGLIVLKKYANQGSSVTFALQSIVYACICYAAVIWKNGVKVTPNSLKTVAKRVRVFGDDLIVPSSAVPELKALLHTCGLKVNASKTHYWVGSFRESCGMDAYDGKDVSPFYLSKSQLELTPKGIVSWVDQANVAYDKGLWHLSSWMVDSIPSTYRNFIPVLPCPNGGLYFRTMQNGSRVSARGRYNKYLQRTEIQQLSVATNKQTGSRVGDQDLLHFFINVGSEVASSIIPKERNYAWSWSNRLKLKRRWVLAEGRQSI